MLHVHFSLFPLAHIIVFLYTPVTWAYILKSDSCTAIDPVPSATLSNLAPAWPSSMPPWSNTAIVLPTAASSSFYDLKQLDYQPASAAPVTTSPPAAYTAAATTCTTYAPCNLFYQFVTVLYWPGPSQKTDCLPPTATNPPNPPGLTPQAPSLYAIFGSIIASDGCSLIGNTYASLTTSFAPGELSTIDGNGVTRVFDSSHFPCGPAGDDPYYSPLIAPPAFLTNLDPAFATCIPGREQGIDPPQQIQAAQDESRLDGPGHPPHRRIVRAPAHVPAKPTPN